MTFTRAYNVLHREYKHTPRTIVELIHGPRDTLQLLERHQQAIRQSSTEQLGLLEEEHIAAFIPKQGSEALEHSGAEESSQQDVEASQSEAIQETTAMASQQKIDSTAMQGIDSTAMQGIDSTAMQGTDSTAMQGVENSEQDVNAPELLPILNTVRTRTKHGLSIPESMTQPQHIITQRHGRMHQHHLQKVLDKERRDKELSELGQEKSLYVMRKFAEKAIGQTVPDRHPNFYVN
jgi:hypothetical protein